MYYENQTVFYLDKEKKIYSPARFKCYLRDNFVQVVPHERYKNDVVIENELVRPSLNELLPGSSVLFIKPYDSILMKYLGCNEATVISEREKRYTISIGRNKYRRVHPAIIYLK